VSGTAILPAIVQRMKPMMREREHCRDSSAGEARAVANVQTRQVRTIANDGEEGGVGEAMAPLKVQNFQPEAMASQVVQGHIVDTDTALEIQDLQISTVVSQRHDGLGGHSCASLEVQLIEMREMEGETRHTAICDLATATEIERRERVARFAPDTSGSASS
jgi:hypothetical protein